MMVNKAIKLFIPGALIIWTLQMHNGVYAQSSTPKTNSQAQVIKNITPDEALVLIEKNKDNSNLVILDVRTDKEFKGGHIENAINLDFYSETFTDDLNKLDKDKIYITHCQAGGRSAKTLEIMEDLGFIEVYNMEGGIAEWKKKGLPTVKSP
jgi:rhodanese-related sulfurtransferase